jgi:predicted house-cleaning noncanonical NTP pyrophosphatase (MazG superfamily)
MIKVYNKLVRDRIPEICMEKGIKVKTRIACDEEYKDLLYQKLREEVDELLESRTTEEFADVVEVLGSILQVENVSHEELQAAVNRKLGTRGGFDKKVVLIETDEDGD